MGKRGGLQHAVQPGGGVCLHPQTNTWHFSVGFYLTFASSIHQGIEPSELGQRLTLHQLKIGAVVKCLGRQVCVIFPRALGERWVSRYPKIWLAVFGVVWF